MPAWMIFRDLSREVKSAIFEPTRQTFYETVETVFEGDKQREKDLETKLTEV